MTPILALAGLSKRFHAGTPSETVALRGVGDDEVIAALEAAAL